MKKIKHIIKRAFRWILYLYVSLYIVSDFIIPKPVFEAPTSTVIEDKNGYLLGARIATDGQWRFPESDSIPDKFKTCILLFEDEYFYYHPGFNPFSLGRALRKNIQAGKVIQGGSSLTQQVARILRNGKSRSINEKIIEAFLAIHLEINYDKNKILNMYASNAPFGGNVVGLEAAAWRYFGRSPHELSWAENAVLAVLPNAPSLIYPGKSHASLKRKRDQLLDKLCAKGIIDKETRDLSKLEEIPEKPMNLPKVATHLLDRANQKHHGKKIKCTVDYHLQENAQGILNRYTSNLAGNEIHNSAAIIIEVKTGSILAYVGNATNSKEHGNQVDVIKSNRSTGSVLKPFLYAKLLTDGEILPSMLVDDIPTYIGGYSPKNYFLHFDGAVKANEALYRSLNVPFVRLLQKHRVENFYALLKKTNMTSLYYPSSHYGLSLILGGAEGKLVDLGSMYASMARVLHRYNETFKYDQGDYFISDYVDNTFREGKKDYLFSASAIYETFEALTHAKRPISDEGWKSFKSSRKIAWKTGTSFGNKDAWSIGVTPEYVVAVWVGNADGEGRPGLTGVASAAPLMLELFNLLPSTSWFDEPYEDYDEITVCTKSGYRASSYCEHTDTITVPSTLNKTGHCPYHKVVHLSKDGRYQVNMDCESQANIDHKKWFSLPPVQEWYFKKISPLYQPLPPLRLDCGQQVEAAVMEFIYPKNINKIYIPKELDGKKGAVIFEIAHRNNESKVYWHLDNDYIGMTQDFHQMAINAKKGHHVVTVMDENGNEIVKKIEVLSE